MMSDDGDAPLFSMMRNLIKDSLPAPSELAGAQSIRPGTPVTAEAPRGPGSGGERTRLV